MIAPVNSIPPSKNWFARNWKWFVPAILGCGILIFVAFFVAVFAGVSGMMKKSEPYQHGIAVVSHDRRALQALGGPIQTGWNVTGSVNSSVEDGNARLAIPLRGRLRAGTLYVVAKASAGKWTYDRLELVVEGQPEGIDFVEHHSGASGKF